MVNECVFCVGTPLTKEHVWPQWIRALFQAELYDYQHGAVTAKGSDVSTEMDSWRAPMATHTSRIVCGRCNGGWMSELESDAKPILSRMIQGHQKRLSQTSQSSVSCWAVKTAMVFDRSYPKARWWIPEEHLHRFHGERRPAPGTYIWLACYGLKNRVATHTSFPWPPQQTRRRGYGVTLSVGHFVAQLFYDPTPSIGPLR